MNNIFIEAESFKNKGGWVIDTASMETIHSAYLMAHGMGNPVEDAFTDFEITDNGKIKYIGTDISPYSSVFPLDENSRFLDNILYICSQKQFDKTSAIEINSFVSISDSNATSSDNEIIMLEFKIPDNAQSGYLHVSGDYFKFRNILFSDEKLIIVDENGNEVTE